MATFVLIHGSSGNGRQWRYVAPLLAAAGHDVRTPDLPAADETAGFAEYTEAVVATVPDRAAAGELVVVGHSMGAFTAPLAAQRLRADAIALVTPMIPAPGDSPGSWWDPAGQPEEQAAMAEREGFDTKAGPETIFFQDVSPDVAEVLRREGEPPQAAGIFGCTWPLPQWPAIPTRVLLGRDDRFFPAPLVRRLARERLGVDAEELPGGHFPAFARPAELTAWLLGCVAPPTG
jgi:pimeloyl-ACP methyl ester carboxylesterase